MKTKVKLLVLMAVAGLLGAMSQSCGSNSSEMLSSTLPVPSSLGVEDPSSAMDPVTLYFDGNPATFTIQDLAIALALFLNNNASVEQIQQIAQDVFGITLTEVQITGANHDPLAEFDLDGDGVPGQLGDLGVALGVFLGATDVAGVQAIVRDIFGFPLPLSPNLPLPVMGATPFPMPGVNPDPMSNNLLVNPGNEDPNVGGMVPGWTVIQGSWSQPTPVPGSFPEPSEGASYFYGGNTSRAELNQTVDVSAFANTIDAGSQAFSFVGRVRSFNQNPPDLAQIVVEYLSADGSLLEAFDTGETASVLDWQRVEDIRTAPPLTRSIRVRLISIRRAGSSNDGYFDDLFLGTTNETAPPPIPTVGTKVNTLADENGENRSGCSFREAIIASNIDDDFGGCNAPNGIIEFDNALFGGRIILTSPLPTISTDVRILGGETYDPIETRGLFANVQTVLIDGNNQFRVLDIANADVEIIGLIITNGNLEAGNLSPFPPVAPPESVIELSGAGIRNRGGILSLENVLVINNETQARDFIDGSTTGGIGGGIYNDGILQIVGSLFANNESLLGNAIFNNRASLTVVGSEFNSNVSFSNSSAAAIEGSGGQISVKSTFFELNLSFNIRIFNLSSTSITLEGNTAAFLSNPFGTSCNSLNSIQNISIGRC